MAMKKMNIGDTFMNIIINRKIHRQAVSVIFCILLISCQAAFAWTAEEVYESVAQLPESVRNALPTDMDFLYGIRTGVGLFALFDAGNNTRQAYLFRGDGKSEDPSTDTYILECKSAPLPFLGSNASIGSSGSDTLYLNYENNPWHCATFERNGEGKWKLVGVQTDHTYYTTNAFGVYGERMDTSDGSDTLRYLPGKMDVDLSYVDVSIIPAVLDDAIAIVDTSGYAMISTENSSHLVGLYTHAEKTSTLLGEYCQGTP